MRQDYSCCQTRAVANVNEDQDHAAGQATNYVMRRISVKTIIGNEPVRNLQLSAQLQYEYSKRILLQYLGNESGSLGPNFVVAGLSMMNSAQCTALAFHSCHQRL